eukprot:TRINITY_DN1461_c0_g1_i2.p1 TRINITY_DN1461_c0_g1~~TRINITY_DN1461_c0_g1_i2.p1  ORF type:complete len:238 (+),score=46.29 TRINITY_DN1461_c0_g1_i2:38-751(+)
MKTNVQGNVIVKLGVYQLLPRCEPDYEDREVYEWESTIPNFELICLQETFSDIVLYVGDDRNPIYAHKCILASRCPYLNRFITEECTELTINGEYISRIALEYYLKYLYHELIDVPMEILVDVLLLSLVYFGTNGYQSRLITYIFTKLAENITDENAEIILAIAQYSQNRPLTICALHYIAYRIKKFKGGRYEFLKDRKEFGKNNYPYQLPKHRFVPNIDKLSQVNLHKLVADVRVK